MRLTRSQIDRMYTSLGYQHAYRRQPEARWYIAVGLFLFALVVIVATSASLPGGW